MDHSWQSLISSRLHHRAVLLPSALSSAVVSSRVTSPASAGAIVARGGSSWPSSSTGLELYACRGCGLQGMTHCSSSSMSPARPSESSWRRNRRAGVRAGPGLGVPRCSSVDATVPLLQRHRNIDARTSLGPGIALPSWGPSSDFKRMPDAVSPHQAQPQLLWRWQLRCSGSKEGAEVSDSEDSEGAPSEASKGDSGAEEGMSRQDERTEEPGPDQHGGATNEHSLEVVKAQPLEVLSLHTSQGSVSGGVSGASSQSTDDWRVFRARLVASERAEVRARPGDGGIGVSEILGEGAGNMTGISLGILWAHALYAPEKGCLLVASELLHGYNFFQRSVILLLGVGTGPSDGPYGIALNKPFPRTVAQVDSLLPGLANSFGPCQVHVGGPIGPRTVLLVHGHMGLDGHCEVLPGVFVAGLAGLPAASHLVESGRAEAEDFQIVLGYAGWGEEQLRQEIAQGWWYVAACSPQVVLEARKRCAGGEGDRLWHDVLHLMGGEYAEVGRRSIGDD